MYLMPLYLKFLSMKMGPYLGVAYMYILHLTSYIYRYIVLRRSSAASGVHARGLVPSGFAFFGRAFGAYTQ